MFSLLQSVLCAAVFFCVPELPAFRLSLLLPLSFSPFTFFSHLFPFSLSSLAKGKHSLFSKESLTLCPSLFSHLFSQNSYSFLITREPCILSPFTGLITSTLWCCLWVGTNRSSGLCHENLKGEDVAEDICLLVGF